MKVRLTRTFVPPPEWGQFPYREGLIVTGQVAAWALKEGAGFVVGPELTTKIVLPDEVKAKRGRPRKSEVA
jgi:hypothetical protein